MALLDPDMELGVAFLADGTVNCVCCGLISRRRKLAPADLAVELAGLACLLVHRTHPMKKPQDTGDRVGGARGVLNPYALRRLRIL